MKIKSYLSPDRDRSRSIDAIQKKNRTLRRIHRRERTAPEQQIGERRRSDER